MALLPDYKQCLIDIVTNGRNLDEANFTKGNLGVQLQQALQDLAELEHTAGERLQREYAAQLKRILDEQTAHLVGELRNLESRLSALPQEIQHRRQEIQNMNASADLAEEYARLERLLQYLAPYEAKFSEVDKRLDSVIKTQVTEFPLQLIQIEAAAGSLMRQIDRFQPRNYKAPWVKIINFLLFDSAKLKWVTPMWQLILYILWCGVLLWFTLNHPLVFALPYSLVYFYSLYRTAHNINRVLNLYYPLRILQLLTEQRMAEVLQATDMYKQRCLAELNAEFVQREQALRQEIHQQNCVIELERQRIERETPEEVLTAATRESLKNTLQAKQAFAASLQKQLQENAENLQALGKHKAELEALRVRLRQELIDTYLRPVNPGTSKLLPQSFFLGFDNEGALIEFEYQGNSTLVEYIGESSSGILDLIFMMVVQLTMAMDMTCLNVSFVDSVAGGFDYSMFQFGELKEIFEIVPTDEEQRNLLESLHADLQVRSRQILTMSDNITDYNTLMLQRKSFTLDYRVIFFQTISEAVLTDDKFLQLCMNGPRVGIVPIVFMSTAKLKEVADDRMENRLLFCKFLGSITSRMFRYDCATANLEAMPATYRDRLIELLRRNETK